MADKLKQIPKQLLNFWNKYTKKQKTIFISVVCIVILAFTILIIITGRVEYKKLTVAETPKDAGKIVDLLKGDGIKYKLGSDNLTVSVDLKKYSDAVLLLAGNDMPSTGISLDEVLKNSLGTTNYDRTLKINLLMQNQVRNYLIKMKGVDDAQVYYIPVDNSDSILTPAQDTSASVLLTTNDDFEEDSAETIAQVVASAIGNNSTDKIKVADQNGKLLFGGEQDLYTGTASSTADYTEKLRNTFINNLYMGLIKSGYDDVVIMPNLKMNFDKVTELYTEYLPAEGSDQGLFSKSYTYNSQNAGSSGGVPGTSSNDETDTMIKDSGSTSGNVKIEEYNYLPNERVTNTEKEIGAIDPANSSVSIVLKRLIDYKQENMEKDGTLNGTTFAAYVKDHKAEVKLQIDQDLITMVSKATGIAESNIHITATEKPVFIPKVVKTKSWTDYLQIILVVLIVALLFFVIFKAFKPVEVTELEPELSVEQLLATTKENQSIEDIEFNEESEVRKMINKFVDEKPEAVAQLLRNWLNDDWN